MAGIVIANASPRTTKLLHELCNLAGFLDVGVVFHEGLHLGRETGPSALSLGRLDDRLTSRLGAGDSTTTGNLIESAMTLAAESQRQGRRKGRFHPLDCSAKQTTCTERSDRHRCRSDPSLQLVGFALFDDRGVPATGRWPDGDDREISEALLAAAAEYGLRIIPKP